MNKFLLRNSSAPKEPFPTSNLEEFWSLTRKFHGSGLTLHVYTIKLRDPSAIQDDPKVNKIVYILKVPLYTYSNKLSPILLWVYLIKNQITYLVI